MDCKGTGGQVERKKRDSTPPCKTIVVGEGSRCPRKGKRGKLRIVAGSGFFIGGFLIGRRGRGERFGTNPWKEEGGGKKEGGEGRLISRKSEEKKIPNSGRSVNGERGGRSNFSG